MSSKRKFLFLALIVVTAVSVLVAASVGGAKATGGASKAAPSGSITVWVDAVRLPAAKKYIKAHPKVKVKLVTFDGDGNGATTLQAKIQLWNRVGKGWPDVIFSEQANDPVWMAARAFDYAAPLKGLIPAKVLNAVPAPSRSQCTVNGKEICIQDNLAPTVLWYDKTLMNKFGYTVPTTWQQWAALGQKVAAEHPGYIIGNTGDSYSHWTYLWADQCPLSQVQKNGSILINSVDAHCTRMASLLDPLIKNGTTPPENIFTPAFAQKYGGADSKVLMMPGPAWYAKDVFDGTLKIPAGHMTAAMPLRWNNEAPITTGQIGGGPWIISKHSKNLPAAAEFVTWVTTSPVVKDTAPGLPSYAPAATRWLARLGKDPYFAASPAKPLAAASGLIWKGWSMVTYPDQPVWSNTVVTQLVDGKSLSSLLPSLGDELAKAAQAAGYKVVRK
jgi:ABC-type glycerol-3-phosphate transport system substrate-binding protein